ncbi:MAG: UDP-N-acetylglucosamine enolpyruvyl transferase [candidate division TM6 bacterium GW2011_GWF2_37_49]|nr:MAG: UDP-N-acetylglucosamine enolpyruvyl transferase [candidate division TM6 bacterium GW2011_GWF2_37_49]
MQASYILVKKSAELSGTVELVGAKNAVLVIISSLILTKGRSVLENVPNSSDVLHMISLLTDLGGQVEFDTQHNRLIVDTSDISKFDVKPEIMNKMRASILVMGPLLARFGMAKVAFPGGCVLGARPIDYHINGFKKIGVKIEENGCYINSEVDTSDKFKNVRISFEYPSVGATENLMMFAVLKPGQTVIINAALEPEVLDLIEILTKMGAKIDCGPGAIITVTGVDKLNPVKHEIIPDRLEAGTLLIAGAITGGQVTVKNAVPEQMDMFLDKLREMGHEIETGMFQHNGKAVGITINAIKNPQGIRIKTGPYPAYPTDLQAPTMAMLCLTNGTSYVEETVFENRFMHIPELQKMGSQISVKGNTATIRGVDELYGTKLIATDIRASCALVIAGLAATGSTEVTGIQHWRRGYDKLEYKLNLLGGNIEIFD